MIDRFKIIESDHLIKVIKITLDNAEISTGDLVKIANLLGNKLLEMEYIFNIDMKE